MKIELNQVGKKYTSGWVFQNLNHCFAEASITGIRGKNGSGKSTLLQIISSLLTPTEGKVSHFISNEKLPTEVIPQRINHIAPSIELISTLTVTETLQFHFAFRQMITDQSINDLLETVWLSEKKQLAIEELSSGMRQRLQLALAFYTQSDLILLDEPTSNLDREGVQFFYHLIEQFQKERTIIIASNEERDFAFCQHVIDINQWK